MMYLSLLLSRLCQTACGLGGPACPLGDRPLLRGWRERRKQYYLFVFACDWFSFPWMLAAFAWSFAGREADKKPLLNDTTAEAQAVEPGRSLGF